MTILINGQKLNTKIFKNGECYLEIDPKTIEDHNFIETTLHSSDDILFLLLSINALRSIKADVSFDLFILEFPYSRQDKIIKDGCPFSLNVMADLINGLDASKVIVADPHSDMTSNLLKNVHIIPQHQIIKNSSLFERIKNNNLAIVAPDSGSVDKILKLKKTLEDDNFTPHVLYAKKERDQESGRIIKTEICGDVQKKNHIIIDDICDSGETVIELSKHLKAFGALDIYLYVTHGIFSGGLNSLRSYIKHIYCYHIREPLKEENSDFITILKNEKK